MDKIWDRNPSKSEVIGRCGGDEKTVWPRRTDKSRTLKNKTTQFNAINIFMRRQTKLVLFDEKKVRLNWSV